MNETSLTVIIICFVFSLVILIFLCIQDFDAVVFLYTLFFILCIFAILLVPFWVEYQCIFGQYNSIKEDLENPYCTVSTERIQKMNARLYSYQKDYQDGKILTCSIFGDGLMELEFLEEGE